MTQNETLVPLDLSDAIALIDRQKAALAEKDKQIVVLTEENERLRKVVDRLIITASML